MRPKGVLLIGAAISTIVLSQTASARDDSAPFVVAQQDQSNKNKNKDKDKNKNQNQNQRRDRRGRPGHRHDQQR